MDEAGTQGSNRFYTSPQEKPKTSSRILFIILAVILIGLAIFGATRFFGTQQEKEEIAPTPTPTQEVLPTDTPTPEASPTDEVTKTPTPKPTSNPVDKGTGLDRSKLTIQILNGSGVAGAASKIAELLRGLGYKISSTGNADSFDYIDTSIQVKSANSSYLTLLKSDLQGSYTIGSTSATLATGSADAIVIVGK